jgi:hypothetical protein
MEQAVPLTALLATELVVNRQLQRIGSAEAEASPGITSDAIPFRVRHRLAQTFPCRKS